MKEILNFTLEIEETVGSIEEKISRLIKNNEEKFESYFHRLIDTEDARYTIARDSLNIEGVHISDTQGSAFGNFTWEFYAGCKDIDTNGETDFEIDFKISGRKLIFNIELPPVWRSDAD